MASYFFVPSTLSPSSLSPSSLSPSSLSPSSLSPSSLSPSSFVPATIFQSPRTSCLPLRKSRHLYQSRSRITMSEMNLTADPKSWTRPLEPYVLSQPPEIPPAETFLPLQNGSDVRGVALDLDPDEPITLTRNHVRMIMAAFTRYVRQHFNNKATPKIAIGRDSRLSGNSLLGVAVEGIIGESGHVINTVLETTPAMFMTTVLRGCDAAVMVTASHLPKNRNGLKFFIKDKGGLNSTEVRELLESAGKGWVGTKASGKREENSFLAEYADFLKKKVVDGAEKGEKPLEGFRIIVDAGNGAGGFFATNVLHGLGADITGSQFLEEDGNFPNHAANPEDKKAIQMIVDATVKSKADLGVIFDTDVDRCALVDRSGKPISRNRLIALMSKIVLRTNPGATIVTDSVTSNGLTRFIEKYGGKHFRYRRGYKNVIDKAIELDAPLAIETSGHAAMKENYMLDDGSYLVVKILIEMVKIREEGKGGTISELIADLEEPQEAHEFRLGFKDQEGYKDYGKQVVESFKPFASTVDGWTLEENNYEGVRVKVDEGNGKEGWLLLRQSLHDPVLPLNIESEIVGGTEAIIRILCDKFFPSQENVNVDVLQQYLAT